MKIYGKLLDLQQRIKIGKEMTNHFGGFNYRSAEQMLSIIKPMLGELGLVLIFKEEVVNEKFMKGTATLIDSADGEKIETSSSVSIDFQLKGMALSQASGATISYLRKYLLGGLLAIDDGKDADSLPPLNPNIRAMVNNCSTIRELNDLFRQYGGSISENEKRMFTQRKITLKNENNGKV